MAGLMSSMNTAGSAGEAGPEAPAATPATYFLRRLHRLIALSARPDLDPIQRRLVNHAKYSTYWDCVELGLQSTAATVLALPPQR